MAPDRDQLRAISCKDKETFKEDTQRWRGIAAQVSPPLEEKEMTYMFLKTLSLFCNDRMVNIGLRLEEGILERLLKEGISSNSSRKYGNGLPKKKEHDANVISQERRGRLSRKTQRHQHVASVTPVINATLVAQVGPSY